MGQNYLLITNGISYKTDQKQTIKKYFFPEAALMKFLASHLFFFSLQNLFIHNSSAASQFWSLQSPGPWVQSYFYFYYYFLFAAFVVYFLLGKQN